MKHLCQRGILAAATVAAVASLLPAAAQALAVRSISPQGEVAQVRQVVVRFDEAAIAFGDAAAAAPVAVRCNGAPDAARGTGRWTSDREWVFDFANDLPPGVRCTVAVVSSFQSHKGKLLPATPEAAFNTGGPFVRQVRPGTGGLIDEEQFFALRLNGPAEPASVLQHAACRIDGVGERVAVRAVEGADRTALLKAMGWERAAVADPLTYPTLACTRRLPSGGRMQLVWAAGIATPSGVANRVERAFDYRVREPFTASFTCERENAEAACLPLRPLRLQFSAPVARKDADAVRLKGGGKTYTPDAREGEADELVSGVAFAATLPEKTALTIELPAGLKDASGRPLQNADTFPLKVATGPMPPLAKFAAAPFGIVERLAEPDGQALLPVTLRNVEGAGRGAARQLRLTDDAAILAWLRRVEAYGGWNTVPRERARADSKRPLPKPLRGGENDEPDRIQGRMVGLLEGQAGVQALALPQKESGDPRPFEVVGIPLQPGFHVVEIASKQLGMALLDERLGADRAMYVRTAALVTNLGVHFKLGREDSLAWVTTLDKGRPVAGAQVRVSDCRGKLLAQGTTDAAGTVRIEGLSSQPAACGDGSNAYFVTARAKSPDGVDDLAFTFTDWTRGIESWRFDLPTSSDPQPDAVAHTVLDRSLLRAGETVSMKHLVRSQTGRGFGLPRQLPGTLTITHQGSGQQFTQPIAWRKTATGGQSAESTWQIPPAAKLGTYAIELSVDERGSRRSLATGSFRVAEFRLPVLQGRVGPADKAPLVRPTAVPTAVQVDYVAGGPAANLPVRVSALLRDREPAYADFDAFSFRAPRARGATNSSASEEEAAARSDSRVVADKLAATLDKSGAGRVTVQGLKPASRPQELLLEATYADPNGEIQTIRSTHPVWPAAVVAGIKAEGWASTSRNARFSALALGLDGKPAANTPIDVKATARVTTTTRKRMVGGFYSYDNKTETKELGTVCSGKTDARGLLLCDAALKDAGEIELVAVATDSAGRTAEAAASVWVTRQGELWFGGEDHDRIDLLPEKKRYEPGETARLQVRMPFRFATALVTVEREGILHSEVVQLNGQDPTVSLKVQEGWGPNAYASVLVLRGRLREVPWYSFFTWGFKAPREWWTAYWHEGREYVAPTAMVDLSKPAFRLGVAELVVGTRAHELAVQVAADQPAYPVRGTARVTVTARLPDGKPAAHAEVALAAVDQALLELAPNPSWDLLEAMLQRRSWGVETATAHMEIIGRRHYGRKAVPAGGGGGKSPTRELLDTLLLWNPKVQLDAQGRATVDVPLNDALTSFRIVAVADAGTGRFGTGSTTIRSTQDLQIVSGLPPLVREGDAFRAQLTLRNTTAKAMTVEVAPRATLLDLKPQTVAIPANEAREFAWEVVAPQALAFTRPQALLWEIAARDTGGTARDALKVTQRIVPAVPLTVQQATLVQLDSTYTLDVAPPAGALPESGAKQGGIKLSLQPRLAEGLPGVRDFFANYPFVCLEQKASKAIGLRDAKLWQQVVAQLPGYLDADGLPHYFPPRDGDANRGSDVLAAYLLAATHEAAQIDPAFAMPPELQARMLAGLAAFAEGRIQREHWSPRKDLDVRKLAALEALSRHGKAAGRMAGSITVAPNQWPTHAVVDWLAFARRTPDLPQRAERMAEAQNILRARLSYQGTKALFSTEQDDYWWWLMRNGDETLARLLLVAMDDPAWKDELPRLANGFVARQQQGAWHTTTANLWGGLALERFSRTFESTPVAGTTRATLGGAAAAIDWSKVARVAASDAAGAPHQAAAFGAPAAPGMLRNNSATLPWAAGALAVTHQGSGRPWLTVQSLSAVARTAPFAAGYGVKRTVTPVEQAVAGRFSRGDVLRVQLEVDASADMSWVVLTDPIPSGSTLLGDGLGRDSAIATRGERAASGRAWPAFEERSFEAFRSYYAFMPKGKSTVGYTVRLNNVGDFALPPTRVEAMYAPEMFGEAPNARMQVLPR